MSAHRFPVISLVRLGALMLAAAIVSACAETSAGGDSTARTAPAATAATAAPTPSPECDPGDGGITVPSGYCAAVFADNLGHARHLVVAPSGDVYVNTWTTERTKTAPPAGGYVVALRDSDKNGRADTIERFGTVYTAGVHGGGTGIGVHGDGLFVEVDDRIVRYRLTATLTPPTDTELALSGLPRTGDHQAHPFAIAPDGTMYVNSGSKTNACQVKNRAIGSPGQQPCAELAQHAGIWRYRADKLNQTFSARERFATGLRNTMALAVNPTDGTLYAAVHGRDQLSENWPKLYTAAQNTELPAETLVAVAQGKDYGWPMCYYDAAQSKYVLAPEYGGDGGKSVRGCENKESPLVTFPAHWAPNGLALTGSKSPIPEFEGGAFVAFHGSWNREPTQGGFLIAFVPFVNGKPAGAYQEFATGFAGPALPAKPDEAAYRPVGVALGPDGAIYVADDVKGRIWRIVRISR